MNRPSDTGLVFSSSPLPSPFSFLSFFFFLFSSSLYALPRSQVTGTHTPSYSASRTLKGQRAKEEGIRTPEQLRAPIDTVSVRCRIFFPFAPWLWLFLLLICHHQVTSDPGSVCISAVRERDKRARAHGGETVMNKDHILAMFVHLPHVKSELSIKIPSFSSSKVGDGDIVASVKACVSLAAS